MKADARVRREEVDLRGPRGLLLADGTFDGRAYSTDYENNLEQFESVAPGGTVPVLLDPENPDIIRTVADVRDGADASFGVLAAFGIVVAIGGVAGLVYDIRLWRRPDRD